MSYTIGEVSKKLNIPATTLRFYDKKGLLSFVDRSTNGVRLFKESDLMYLTVIECLKKTGMRLSSIKDFIDLCMQGEETAPQRLEIILEQQACAKTLLQDVNEQMTLLECKEWYYRTLIEKGNAYFDMITIAEVPNKYHKYLFAEYGMEKPTEI